MTLQTLYSALVEPLVAKTLSDVEAIEATALDQRLTVGTTYEVLDVIARTQSAAPAIQWLPLGYPSDDDRLIDYGTFAGCVRQFANFLRDRGLKRSDVVAYILPNLPETHFVIQGGQAACVVMPLNPLLDTEHLAAMINQVGAKVVVTANGSTHSSLVQKAKSVLEHVSHQVELICVEMDGRQPGDLYDLIENYRSDRLEFAYDAIPSDPATYMHTGGTTGAPKLAIHTHWAEVTQAWTLASISDIRRTDATIAGLPLFHASAFRSTGIACWIAGASIVLIGPDGFRNPESVLHFWETIETYRVTGFMTVSAVYSSLLKQPVEDYDISSVRMAASGAAPLPVQIIREFDERFGIPISEGYGLTEGTCISSRNPKDGERKVGSVGFRIPYQQMKTVELDEEGRWKRDCKTDEVGVIAIKGPNVIDSYLNAAPDEPLGIGDGWINTGDLAWQDKDGYFFITGRRKDLIIRSGHNIDPQLIEDVLHAHPEVDLAAAVGMPDAYAGELPAAFVTLKDGASARSGDLREWAFDRISERPAVPKVVFIVDAMPLTPIGKVSKLQLRCRAAEHVILHLAKTRLRQDESAGVLARPSERKGMELDISLKVPRGEETSLFENAAHNLFGSFAFGYSLNLFTEPSESENSISTEQ